MSGKWNPAQYDKFKQQRQQPFYDLLALVEPRQGARVIDLGCGTGELTAALHTHLQAGQTVGVDTSADMLANAASLNIEGLHFLQTDISKVLSGWRGQTLMESPLAGRYDIIFSNAALQWVPGHQSLIGDLISGLMPGGQLAVQVPAGNDHPTHTVANEIAAQEPFSTMIGESGRQVGRVDWVLAPEEYATLLDEQSVSAQHVRLQVYGHHLASTYDLVEWMKGTLLTGYQEILGPDGYQMFLSRYSERLIEILGERRPYFFGFKRILIWAVK